MKFCKDYNNIADPHNIHSKEEPFKKLNSEKYSKYIIIIIYEYRFKNKKEKSDHNLLIKLK